MFRTKEKLKGHMTKNLKQERFNMVGVNIEENQTQNLYPLFLFNLQHPSILITSI